MKILANNLNELREANIPALYDRINAYCNSFNQNEDPKYHIGNNFEIDLGGPIMLVETEEDLSEIKTTRFDDKGFYASISEKADTFDVCEYFDDRKYVYVLMCTHNGGGTTYLIPTQISYKFPTIEESVYLTNAIYDFNVEDEDASYT